MQLASAAGNAQLLEAAKQGLTAELERVREENKDLLQKTALLDSLTAEADALRHQVRRDKLLCEKLCEPSRSFVRSDFVVALRHRVRLRGCGPILRL